MKHSKVKPFRVLSIDWDYVFNATMNQRVTIFPDGHDGFSHELSSIIWSGRYGFRDEELMAIDVDNSILNRITDFIHKWKTDDTLVMVRDSHKHIYDAVLYNQICNQPIELINLDFHHDAYDTSKAECDCGNWVNCIFANKGLRLVDKTSIKDSKYVWIGREDSDKPSTTANWFYDKSIDYLEECDTFPIDLVFICRSSMWSPPHLDDKFEEFCNNIHHLLDKESIEFGDIQNRWKDVSKMRSEVKEFMNKYTR